MYKSDALLLTSEQQKIAETKKLAMLNKISYREAQVELSLLISFSKGLSTFWGQNIWGIYVQSFCPILTSPELQY